jgi:hypothetical protein
MKLLSVNVPVLVSFLRPCSPPDQKQKCLNVKKQKVKNPSANWIAPFLAQWETHSCCSTSAIPFFETGYFSKFLIGFFLILTGYYCLEVIVIPLLNGEKKKITGLDNTINFLKPFNVKSYLTIIESLIAHHK